VEKGIFTGSNFSQEAILKMDFFFSGLFWGIILILLGVSIIIRIVFHINVPIVRIVFAFIIIYFGIKLLVGGNWLGCSGSRTAFGSSTMSISPDRSEYKVVFGSSVIDATAEVTGSVPERSSIRTVFGQCHLTISPKVPTIIRVSSAFGEARLPDGSSVIFGESTYKNAAAREGKSPMREIDANVVFGNFVVTER
jgi:hypothetical protein